MAESFEFLGKPVAQKMSQFLTELEKMKENLFETWIAEASEVSKVLASLKSGKLMELEPQTGKLIVHYDNKLVQVTRECRQLVAFGFSVPMKIQSFAVEMDSYQRNAISLKQIAHFYNTIEQQIHRFQQPMLIQQALELEKLIKNPGAIFKDGTISWENREQVQKYVQVLQNSVEAISVINRKLRKTHEDILLIIKGLAGLDLVKQQAKWKAQLNDIRTQINQIISALNIPHDDTLAWRVFLDQQLHKALEAQFRLGLELMHESMPEMNGELVFRDGKLTSKPSPDEFKTKYDREMKKFLQIPAVFRGVAESKFFAQTLSTSADAIQGAQKQFETLFKDLEKEIQKHSEWGSVGSVELKMEDSVFEFEERIKKMKVLGKEIEKLPTSIKVGCITLSTLTMKNSVDNMIQTTYDTIVESLRKSILSEIKSVEVFLEKGVELLSRRPQSLLDVGEARNTHRQLSEEKPKVAVAFLSVTDKNKLLKTVTGSIVESAEAEYKWNKLESLLDGHALMIDEQVQTLKGKVESKRKEFESKTEVFAYKWQQIKPTKSFRIQFQLIQDISNSMKEILQEFESLKKMKDDLANECVYFGVEVPNFTMFDALSVELAQFMESWSSVSEFSKELGEFGETDWLVLRVNFHKIEEFVDKWSERLKNTAMNLYYSSIVQELDFIRRSIPVFKILKGDTWMPEHWGHLFFIIGLVGVNSLTGIRFKVFLEKSDMLAEKIGEIRALNERATGEIVIRDTLQQLDVWSSSAVYSWKEHFDSRGQKIDIIQGWKDILTQLSDFRLTIQTLRDTPYYGNFSDKIDLWDTKLQNLEICLGRLNNIQHKWVYLEPVFARDALPREAAKFSKINSEIRDIFRHIVRDGRVASLLSIANVMNALADIEVSLEGCQKALKDYLESKRNVFPRLYFINDDDLLEILGQSRNPEIIQSHLKKLFTGVHQVQFSADKTSIVSFSSVLGEVIQLSEPVKLEEKVEVWLAEFTNAMKATLKKLLIKYMNLPELDRSFPTQIIILGENIKFTSKVEKAIPMRNLNAVLEELKAVLVKLVAIECREKDTRGRYQKETLILETMKNMSITERLIASNVSRIDDWIWQKQLKFGVTSTDLCYISVCSSKFDYSFEYQGNAEILVHTPLTEKCYTILSQALASGLGGNPYGPAGTGKTESVKCLGYYFGRQVLVFNCDESMDSKSIVRILRGVSMCGAFACFDEFNRLETTVLSTTSQYIQAIQTSLKKKLTTTELSGQSIPIDLNAGIFVCKFL